MRRAKQQGVNKGASLIEFALVLPILLYLILNVVNFAGAYYAAVNVVNGSRAAADYMVMSSVAYSGTDGASGAGLPPLTGPLDAGNPGGPLLVANVVANDMYSLTQPNSIVVRTCSVPHSDDVVTGLVCNVCTNSNGNGGPMTCTANTGNGLYPNPNPDAPPFPSTGEGNGYRLAWVDVVYTYKPFLPLNVRIPIINLRLTPPPTTMRRQAIYRILH